MSVSLYMDVHVNGAITQQLEVRGVRVITAQDDGRSEEEDEAILQRATDSRVSCSRRIRTSWSLPTHGSAKDVSFQGWSMHINCGSPLVDASVTWN
jgi:hypothetical protein